MTGGVPCPRLRLLSCLYVGGCGHDEGEFFCYHGRARRRRAEFFALWASEDTMREELIQKTEAEMERVQRLRGYL